MFRFVFFLFCTIASMQIGAENPNLLNADSTPTDALQQLLDLLDIPESNLQNIVALTQIRWMQTGKERWEFELIEENKKKQLIPLFKEIGLFDTVDASQTEYDYALIYGGFYRRVQKRVEHLIAEFKRGVRFNKVILLTGKRFLDPDTDEGTLPFKTETEMMLFVWQNAEMPKAMRNLPYHLIDAPRREKLDGTSVRPNTKDTLIEWLATSPEPGKCLFVSNQPFLGYQDSVARTSLPSTFAIETIGIQADQEIPVAVFLDNLARWLYQENIRRSSYEQAEYRSKNSD
jgi:hypothetical protein